MTLTRTIIFGLALVFSLMAVSGCEHRHGGWEKRMAQSEQRELV